MRPRVDGPSRRRALVVASFGGALLGIAIGCVPDVPDEPKPDASYPSTHDSSVLDALADAPGISDAGADTPVTNSDAACDLSKPFEHPSPMEALNGGQDEYAARLAPGELTVYFTRCQPMTEQQCTAWRATRTTRDEAFGAPQQIPVAGGGGELTWSPLGDDVYLDSYATGLHRIHLLTGSDAGVYGPLGSATELLQVSTTTGGGEDARPFISADGHTLVFASSRLGPNSMGWRLYLSERGSQGKLLSASVIASLTTGGSEEIAPVLSPDNRTLYYSRRGYDLDAGDYPGWAIWRATRPQASDVDFTPREELKELEVIDTDTQPTWISGDGCHLLFVSNRGGGAGGFDIWEARKPSSH